LLNLHNTTQGVCDRSIMSMRAKLTTAGTLRLIIDAVKDLVKEVNFDVNETGMQVQCMDSSNVGMVHLMMRESAFEEFECDKPFTMGVNVESLFKVLRMCGPTDRIIMTAGGKVAENRLHFEFESESEGRVADFEMNTMSIEAEPVGVPDNAPDVKVTLPSSELKKTIHDLKEFGDALRVTTTKDGITFNAEGDIGTGNVLLKPRAGTKVDDPLAITGDAEIDMRFGMRYVNLFTRATGLSKSCEFALKQNEPFRLKYYLEEESHGFIEFLLAPKLDA